MPGKILHVLAQRPSLTGSGVTLDAHVRHAATAGWDQTVVVGVPRDDRDVTVADLAPERVRRVTFEGGDLPFPVPGMSDVMPYRSSRWSALGRDELDAYRSVWRRRLAEAVRDFRPDVIQTHHLWVVSALVKDVAPRIPVVAMCHATGLRQLDLCPRLADEVAGGCRRIDRIAVLHGGQADVVRERLGIPDARLRIVGAGYREDLFHPAGRPAAPPPHVAYVGKFSNAKGLPWLLDAWERIARRRPDARLHVCGAGSGPEAEALRSRMAAAAESVALHGQLPQDRLADVLRRCRACVLPSLYEGLPLVLVEALACGCRLAATRLAGVAAELAPHLGWAMDLVDPPRLVGVDEPDPADLPAFVSQLETALESALTAPSPADDPQRLRASLAPFTWTAACGRIEEIWRALRDGRQE